MGTCSGQIIWAKVISMEIWQRHAKIQGEIVITNYYQIHYLRFLKMQMNGFQCFLKENESFVYYMNIDFKEIAKRNHIF